MAEPQPQQPRRPLTIRHATQTDAPHLKRLLRLSYERFSELQMPHDKIESMISKTQELFDDIAGRILKDQDDCILVGEIDGSVVGMAAVTRSNKHEGAVQYVSIDPPVQRQGVGRSLDQAIVEWAQPRFSRLVLWTGYEWAREFYQAMGFQVVRKIPMSGPDANANANANASDQQPPQRFVYQMARHINHHGLVRKVVVVGGTHGNERIGSALAHKWTNHPELLHRATLESSIAIISNREAVRQNVRFIDEDLNRCFTVEAVSKARSADDPSTLSHELRLVRELDQQLGPKHLGRPGCEAIEASKRCKSDFIIDAHSTTSNMGLTLIASPADAFALRVAAHIAFRFPDKNIRIIGPPPESFDFSLITIAPSGLGIEVGPLAHGTLDFKLMQDTEMMVQAALDFIDQHNSHILAGNIDRPLLPRRSHHQGEGNDDESLPSCIEVRSPSLHLSLLCPHTSRQSIDEIDALSITHSLT